VPGDVGFELVAHPLVGATGFTGSKNAGLKLKAAADKAGKPIYLEMSSVNPLVVMEGALQERGDAIADEFFASCTLGAGQFCTNPGFAIVPDTEAGKKFVARAKAKFEAGTPGILLGKNGRDGLVEAVAVLQSHGATLLCGGQPMPGPAYRFANTLLQVTGETFLKQPEQLQTEAFGPVALLVMARDVAQTVAILKQIEGNLTGTIYSDSGSVDDAAYAVIEPLLRQRVGRLINDRMPTGVAVSPAMNHGGPFPSTGHPGFTAVGIPASIQRFTALHCYENVRPGRLPAGLRG
jgi:NADP-dependent aldehyde dehydrogenase